MSELKMNNECCQDALDPQHEHHHDHEHGHGHHHGHEHHHEHSCEHEHDHHHSHNHDHEHHHEHEHDHCHDHEHHHEHAEASLSHPVQVTRHDDAVVGTVICNIPGTYESAVETMKELMNRLAKKVEEKGGLVGHIKSTAREDNRHCAVFVTEPDNIQQKEWTQQGIYIENTSIVFGISEQCLSDMLKDVFSDYIADETAPL